MNYSYLYIFESILYYRPFVYRIKLIDNLSAFTNTSFAIYIYYNKLNANN